MFDLCRWTSGPSGTPPPTVGRTTTAHARDDDQEGRQHDTRTRTRDRRTAVAEQTDRADNAGEGGVEHARDLEEDSPDTLEVC